MSADVLGAERRGHGSRLVLVHGFTQTRRSWNRLTARLAQRHEVIAVDAPGHGESAHDTADLVAGAALLARTGGTATYVGYSMGGRLALHVAVHHPQVVERLVLIGATPGIDDHSERSARRTSDEALAGHLEQVGLDVFLDEWLRQPLFAGLDDETAGIVDRHRNRIAGLAGSLRHAGTGTQLPLWDRLAEIVCPVLLLVGADDHKFRAVAERMATSVADATLAVIPDAGHSVHLERPEQTAEVIVGWLADHPPMARPTDAATP